jgi:hypothetical protein
VTLSVSRVLLLGMAALLLGPHLALAAGAPKIFHWAGMYSAGSGNTDADNITLAGYNPVPFLWRYDPTANGVPSPRARLTYHWQHSGAIAASSLAWRAFLVFQDAAPVIGGNAAEVNDIANTVAWFQKQGYPIDYVFADLEGYYPDGDWSNLYNLINQVRGVPVGATTGIGNFAWYPGMIDLSADYPKSADRRPMNQYYGTAAGNGLAGLNVAMPVAYVMQAYDLHADDPSDWGSTWWQNSGLPNSLISSLTYNQQAAIGSPYLSPNERAGMFYAPLEQVSLAKRNLPAGHQLIPWVSAFQSVAGVPTLQPGMAPTLQDNEALLEHLRLRGADGFYTFGYDGFAAYQGTYADGSTFTEPPLHAYSAAMASAWHSLDWFFALPTQVGMVIADLPLNLLTFKNTGGTYIDPAGRNGGIEWSGYQRGNRVLAVISNLGNGAQAAIGGGSGTSGNWQSAFASLGSNLPAQSPVVPAGNHLVIQYLTDPTLLSVGSYALGSSLGSAQGWHTSPANWTVASAAGSGDGTAPVIAVTNSTATAWVANAQTANPGGIGTSVNDTMVYACKIYTGWSGSGSASFSPVVGTGPTVPVSAAQQGPTLWVYAGGSTNYWAFGTNFASGGSYQSMNAPPVANTWYQVAMTVNPASNLVSIFVRNLTAGGGWILLQFGGGAGTVTSLPAGIVAGTASPSLYNGFEISGSPGAQFDALQAELSAFPPSPAATYDPGTYVYTPPSIGPSPGGGGSPTDGPLPLWALAGLGGGLVSLATAVARRRRRAQRASG